RRADDHDAAGVRRLHQGRARLQRKAHPRGGHPDQLEANHDMKSIVIDIHAHFTPKLLFERFEDHRSKFHGVKLARGDKGATLQFPGTEPTRPIMPRLSDLDDRRAWMDKNQIDHQMVGGWLDSFGYELAAKEGLAWSRYIND